MSYLTRINLRRTSQSEPMPGTDQVPNSAGGFAWAVDDWTRLRRFLILGSAGGSYYAGEHELTLENAQVAAKAIAADGPRAVREIVAISRDGRAASNDAAIFALAMAASAEDEATRALALDALPQVCRTGTHLFTFARHVEQFRGWGRALRRGVGRWYVEQPVDRVAYQAVKYRRRDGMSHRDLLRLAHPGAKTRAGNPRLPVSDEHARLFEWIVRGGGETAARAGGIAAGGGETAARAGGTVAGSEDAARGLPAVIGAFEAAQAATTAAETARLVREHGLPREAVKAEHLDDAEVWAALLERMPMTALLRNLATLTRVGVIAPGSFGADYAAEQLGDTDRLRKARVHPIAVLSALRTYASGHGVRSTRTWDPVAQVVDALDGAFYAAFGNVEPANTRVMLALDVSGSMTYGQLAGVPGLTPRDASAALALVTAATEPRHEIVGFFAGKGGWKSGTRDWMGHTGLTPLAISPRQRLTDAVKAVSDLPFGGTDCSLPMRYALERGREIDTFVIYTDSETWAGEIHPVQALREYRERTGIAARLVVVGMIANGFTIADPEDPGMLDIVGFDTATPDVVSGFARGVV
ncbi:TROVE domain-containing protein [Solirubrobacter phytolaccae]|uniref:TROVE domain-containing protein n=1 Tax=Solirubrobacter phytolaccae TaxID=1404360 RepID=A0A9X3N7G8_9ACTN|nr:TROVE domain-containing protein [Solirubrobacter phytolaccae]MDA0181270.1 TROVE domain-containing protein [Solirubrobacter phytolaccae]